MKKQYESDLRGLICESSKKMGLQDFLEYAYAHCYDKQSPKWEKYKDMVVQKLRTIYQQEKIITLENINSILIKHGIMPNET